MRYLYKVTMLLIRNSAIFSSPLLRNIRWLIYRRLYNSNELYVDEGVVISQAHKNDGAFFETAGKLNIGKNVYIDYSGGIKIGNSVAISEGAQIFTHNHIINGPHKDWHKNGLVFTDLDIESYAWIGASAIILPSVHSIGEGSIIGAGSILTKCTEPYGIYVGNPARKIGQRKVNETT